jgi:hypothetical protein
LSKGFFNGFVHVASSISSNSGFIEFDRGPALRREIAVGTYLIGETQSADYVNITNRNLLSYGVVGRGNSDGLSNYGPAGFIPLPTASATANPAYTADSNPVFHSLPFHPYVAEPLPSDFGMSFHFASSAFDPGDTLVVTAGTEEWEVLAETPGTAGTVATPMFLARMV